MFLNTENLKINFTGWTYKQLQIEANGLVGALDQIWNDVKDSKWIGGNSEGWERFPYYLNGFVPLAYALDDKELINKANKYMDIVITSQREDGKICPKNDTDSASNDIWPLFLILKVITIYGELSKDQRVVNVIKKALYYIDKSINGTTIINWAHARYFECFIAMLYVKKKSKSKKYHAFLKELAFKLKSQGLDYSISANLWKKARSYWSYDTHGVNIAMALKANCLYKELTGIDEGINAYEMLDILDNYHGTAYGHFTSDECLASISPNQGAELCGIVEAMYSYEILYSLTQDPYWLHRLELLAFNGLPATCTTDMWGHQYDQQVNQIACVPVKGKVIYKTNGPESNVFGLEPNYGCCTANFAQGWPLFVFSAYESIKNEVKINIPLPATINYNNETILEVKSEYPFRKEIKLKANNNLKVKLRIPKTTSVSKKYKVVDEFITLFLKANQEKVINLNYEMKLTQRKTNLSVLTYGPLLFSLPISYKMEIKEYERNNVIRKFPYCDYYFIPTSDWAYAFKENDFKVIYKEYDAAFDRNNPPLVIQSKFNKLKWKYKRGYQYIPEDTFDEVLDEVVTINMQPYGSTYLRMTEMPSLINRGK